MTFRPHAPEAQFRRTLRRDGLRVTPQREAVYRYLLGTTSHPTADDVLNGVREDAPGISLATVYKALETLVSCGLAMKLTYGDAAARYDGCTDPHYHARCLDCGSVQDVPAELQTEAVNAIEQRAAGFRVTGHRLELTGFCATCEDRRRSAGSAPHRS